MSKCEDYWTKNEWIIVNSSIYPQLSPYWIGTYFFCTGSVVPATWPDRPVLVCLFDDAVSDSLVKIDAVHKGVADGATGD